MTRVLLDNFYFEIYEFLDFQIGIQMTFLESTSGQASVSGFRSILDFAAPLTKENCPDENPNSAKTIKLKPPAVLPKDHSKVVAADKICVIRQPSEAER